MFSRIWPSTTSCLSNTLCSLFVFYSFPQNYQALFYYYFFLQCALWILSFPIFLSSLAVLKISAVNFCSFIVVPRILAKTRCEMKLARGQAVINRDLLTKNTNWNKQFSGTHSVEENKAKKTKILTEEIILKTKITLHLNYLTRKMNKNFKHTVSSNKITQRNCTKYQQSRIQNIINEQHRPLINSNFIILTYYWIHFSNKLSEKFLAWPKIPLKNNCNVWLFCRI